MHRSSGHSGSSTGSFRRALRPLVVLALGLLVPFWIWGSFFESLFTQQGTVEWIRGYGSLGWMAGMGLLAADLFLPIPGTIVMSALGFLYGAVLGGLLATAGSCLGGMTGYLIGRLAGPELVLRLFGRQSVVEAQEMFQRMGGWLVVLSRWLPLLPETISCMAGVAGMPWTTFTAALVCGTLPLGFLFALIGAVAIQSPVLAVSLSVVLPPLIWWQVRKLVR